jgi:hypothetical protein
MEKEKHAIECDIVSYRGIKKWIAKFRLCSPLLQ